MFLVTGRNQAEMQLQPAHHLLAEQHGQCHHHHSHHHHHHQSHQRQQQHCCHLRIQYHEHHIGNDSWAFLMGNNMLLQPLCNWIFQSCEVTYQSILGIEATNVT